MLRASLSLESSAWSSACRTGTVAGAVLLDPDARGEQVSPPLGTLGAITHDALHRSAEHLVEQVRQPHAAGGRACLGRPDLPVVLDPGVAQLGVGAGHLGQHGPALGEELGVVDGKQQIPILKSIALDAGQEGHPPRELGRQGDFLVGDDGPAHRHSGGTLCLLDHEGVPGWARRIGLRMRDEWERESEQGGTNNASSLCSHRMAHQGLCSVKERAGPATPGQPRLFGPRTLSALIGCPLHGVIDPRRHQRSEGPPGSPSS